MATSKKKIFVCNCDVTMALDGKRLGQALDEEEGAIEVHTQLCRAQIDRFKQAAAAGGRVA